MGPSTFESTLEFCQVQVLQWSGADMYYVRCVLCQMSNVY